MEDHDDEFTLTEDELSMLASIESSLTLHEGFKDDGDRSFLPKELEDSFAALDELVSQYYDASTASAKRTDNDTLKEKESSELKTSNNAEYLEKSLRFVKREKVKDIIQMQEQSYSLLSVQTAKLRAFNNMSEMKLEGNQGKVLQRQIQQLQRLIKQIYGISERVKHLDHRLQLELNRKQEVRERQRTMQNV